MIGGLIPDIRQNMLVIAEEEVAVDSLREEVERAEEDLTEQREKLLALRADVDNISGNLRIGTRLATRDEVRDELARRFHRYQTGEATVAAKRQRLAAREKSLEAARVKLENMLNAKRDMEVEVENLQARLTAYQSQSVATKVEFDDTQVARCKQLVDDLKIRLEVADRLLAADGEYDDLMTGYVSAPEDIEDQIDQHFAADSSDFASLADARR
jgi:DNA repair exonuclease SbcCD ATPase subunit